LPKRRGRNKALLYGGGASYRDTQYLREWGSKCANAKSLRCLHVRGSLWKGVCSCRTRRGECLAAADWKVNKGVAFAYGFVKKSTMGGEAGPGKKGTGGNVHAVGGWKAGRNIEEGLQRHGIKGQDVIRLEGEGRAQVQTSPGMAQITATPAWREPRKGSRG